MKKIMIALALFIGLFSVTVAINADDDIISQDLNDLPAAARTTISKYFPSSTLSYIKIDKDFIGQSYEVKFQDGKEISFDKKGRWTEVECVGAPVPNDFVPATIKTKVNSMFPGQSITKIEKKKNGYYEVEISNRTELEFDRKYNIRDVDD